ncbi:LuxR C-terminal-related transcriptional regulator [Kribbella albertanoniae]|uniref:LuxR family transcriptional regulator n=1 Tax=Kribbella albertanoniae TaxID=1266829 RepID=A0A4R4PMI7_9ACTN|nr:helix-turn-helix transcriptional regulator [Kribbella albertanoniae]TDC23316.1 LuxR family transcriptional regulator [Kribbella albertanoniae]
MNTYHAESARAGLEAAADAGLSWQEFAHAAADLLDRAIPFDSICFGISDPATNLLTGRVMVDIENDPVGEVQFVQYEYGPPDFNHFADLARHEVGVGILDDATQGNRLHSRRMRDYLPAFGVEHELRGVVRSGGRMWGVCTLYRERGRVGFSPAEAQFVHRIESTMALGFRRGLIAAGTGQQSRSPATAVVIFDANSEVLSASATAEERIAELGGDLWTRIPSPVAAVAAATLRIAAGATNYVPSVRLRSPTGEWLALHGTQIRDRDGLTGQIAVTIESAGPAKVIPLIVEAYGLTEREQEVVQRILLGDSTHQIAAALHLSPYTIQDHLKVIFEKVGVSSRRELSSRIYFAQYAGRLGRDVAPDGWFAE